MLSMGPEVLSIEGVVRFAEVEEYLVEDLLPNCHTQLFLNDVMKKLHYNTDKELHHYD